MVDGLLFCSIDLLFCCYGIVWLLAGVLCLPGLVVLRCGWSC